MPCMPRPKGIGRKVAFKILGKPPYLNPRNWNKANKVREEVEKDTYRKVKE